MTVGQTLIKNLEKDLVKAKKAERDAWARACKVEKERTALDKLIEKLYRQRYAFDMKIEDLTDAYNDADHKLKDLYNILDREKRHKNDPIKKKKAR